MYSFFNKTALKLVVSVKNNKRTYENIAAGATGIGVVSWGFFNRDKWVEHEVMLFKNRLSQEERDAIERSPEISKKYLRQCQDEMHTNIMSSVI